jgi:hypothetical protein
LQLNADPLGRTANIEKAPVLLKLPIRRILWLIGLAFVLHEAEEWNLVSWFHTNFQPAAQFNDREARTLLALFALLAMSFTALSIQLLSLRAALFALLPLFIAVVLGNALTHIFWLFYFQSYAPGVLTSIFLLVPLPAPEPREPLQANPTDPILSRRANPGLILPIHFEAIDRARRLASGTDEGEAHRFHGRRCAKSGNAHDATLP